VTNKGPSSTPTASDEEPASPDTAASSPQGDESAPPESAEPADSAKSDEASPGEPLSTTTEDAGQAADIRHLIDGIDDLPLAERAEVFDTVNRRIAERLAEFDGI